jgi:hypothetical protein
MGGKTKMKKLVRHTFVALVICALATIGALAANKDKVKGHVVFATDTMVNGTLVKAGTYELKFDEATGQLTINDGGKVLATSTAHLEKRDNKAQDTVVRTVMKDNAAELVSVTFNGSEQDLVLGGGSGQ